MADHRRRFLVAYDIRDEKRLRAVHKTMKRYGWSMQYSVFICDLDGVERFALEGALCECIHQGLDSVAFIDLGDPSERGRQCFSFLGPAPKLPTTGPVII